MKLDALSRVFVVDLGAFTHDLSCRDLIWNVLFPGPEGSWHHLHVNKYEQTFHITHVDGNSGTLELAPGKSVQAADPMGRSSFPEQKSSDHLGEIWVPLIAAAHQWLTIVIASRILRPCLM